MARMAILLSLLVIFGGDGICEEQKNPDAKESQNLVTAVWRVPPGFISAANPSDRTGTRKPLPGFKSKQNPYAIQYDASEFLKASGVPFPTGSDAVFDQSASSLVVRNTQENLDLIEAMIGTCNLGYFPANVVMEISTFECSLPWQDSNLGSRWPTYIDLTKPTTDLKLLDRVSAVTKSGQRVTMNHVIVPIPPNSVTSPDKRKETESADMFRDGESGTIADAETAVGPDNITIDCIVNYRFRAQPANNTSSEISLKTSFTTWEGYPVVLHISPASNQPGKYVAVVGSVRLVNYGGWNLKETASGPDASSPEISEH